MYLWTFSKVQPNPANRDNGSVLHHSPANHGIELKLVRNPYPLVIDHLVSKN